MKVVNGKTHGFIGKDKIYIGRENRQFGLDRSPLANPYHVGFDGDRAQVIQLFRRWLWHEIHHNANGAAVRELQAIAHRVRSGENIELSCYCAPLECHGDVIVRCIEWMLS